MSSMETIYVGILPSPSETRVIAMASPSETILKARLSPEIAHPRAIATLLEALALWEGRKVRAALVAASKRGVSDSTFYRGAMLDGGEPLFSVDWVPASCGRHRRRDVVGLGNFVDLRQLVLAEIVR
jgi:hypothetical protein